MNRLGIGQYRERLPGGGLGLAGAVIVSLPARQVRRVAPLGPRPFGFGNTTKTRGLSF